MDTTAGAEALPYPQGVQDTSLTLQRILPFFTEGSQKCSEFMTCAGFLCDGVTLHRTHTHKRTVFIWKKCGPFQGAVPGLVWKQRKTLGCLGVSADVGIRNSKYKPEALWPNTAT